MYPLKPLKECGSEMHTKDLLLPLRPGKHFSSCAQFCKTEAKSLLDTNKHEGVKTTSQACNADTRGYIGWVNVIISSLTFSLP